MLVQYIYGTRSSKVAFFIGFPSEDQPRVLLQDMSYGKRVGNFNSVSHSKTYQGTTFRAVDSNLRGHLMTFGDRDFYRPNTHGSSPFSFFRTRKNSAVFASGWPGEFPKFSVERRYFRRLSNGKWYWCVNTYYSQASSYDDPWSGTELLEYQTEQQVKSSWVELPYLNVERFNQQYPTPPEQSGVWGDLAISSFKEIKWNDTLSYEMLQGLNLAREASSLAQSIKTAFDKKTLRTASSAFLSQKFGAPATLKDLSTLSGEVARALMRVKSYSHYADFKVRSRLAYLREYKGLFYRDEYFLTAYISAYPDPIIKLITSIDRSGLWPTTTNAWNLVPLSFVIDWLVDVQGVFEAFDFNAYSQLYSFKAVVSTRKISFLDGSPSAPASFYFRNVSTSFPRASYKLDWGPGLSDERALTATALILQRR